MKLKNIYVKFFGKITGCYNYGKNNKVIFLKKGKEYKKFFMPKGLIIKLEANNGIVKIEYPLKFENTLIDIEGDNGVFEIKHSKYPLRNCRFYIEYNSQIHIGKNCQLKNRNLCMIANCAYNKPAQIIIGDNVLIGTNAIIRTSDGHTLINVKTREPLNKTEDVIIDNNVWIGANCTILKGTYISKGSIVGACSLINKKFEEENIVIAGNPAKILKHNVTWDIKGYGKYRREMEREKK